MVLYCKYIAFTLDLKTENLTFLTVFLKPFKILKRIGRFKICCKFTIPKIYH